VCVAAVCSNIAILGLLLPSYSFTGTDAACHMIEEIEGASTGPAIGMLWGWASCFLEAWA
jgi:hypothetical protein